MYERYEGHFYSVLWDYPRKDFGERVFRISKYGEPGSTRTVSESHPDYTVLADFFGQILSDESGVDEVICVSFTNEDGTRSEEPRRLTRAYYLGLGEDFRFKGWWGSEEEEYSRQLAIDKAADKAWTDGVPYHFRLEKSQ